MLKPTLVSIVFGLALMCGGLLATHHDPMWGATFLVATLVLVGALEIHRASRLRRRRVLRTSRLEIRGGAGSATSAEILAALDDETCEAMGWSPAEAQIQSNRPQLIARNGDGELVGAALTLHDYAGPPALLLRMWIATPHRRQGLGTEMLEGIVGRLDSTHARIAIETPLASQGLVGPLALLGFERAAEFQRVTRDGRRVDIAYFLKTNTISWWRRVRLRKVKRPRIRRLPVGAAKTSLPLGLLTGTQIQIRQLTRFDAAEVGETVDSMSAAAMMETRSTKATRRRLQRAVRAGHTSGMFAVLDTATQSIIGIVTLKPMSHERSTWAIGLWLGPSARGRGVARDVLTTLLPRLRELGVMVVACGLLPTTTFLTPLLLEFGFEEAGYRAGERVDDQFVRLPWFHLYLDDRAGRPFTGPSMSGD